MKSNRGQALVEFIIILPVFLLLMISVIDFGNILYKRYLLEGDLDIITDMYNKEDYTNINSYVKSKNIEINYINDSDFLTINLTKKVNVMSPLLNIIFGKTYEIIVNRSIYQNE